MVNALRFDWKLNSQRHVALDLKQEKSENHIHSLTFESKRMISGKSLQVFVWGIQVGHWLNILPFYWRDGKLGVVKDNRIFNILSRAHILVYLGFSAYFIYRMITIQPKVTTAEIIMIIFFYGLLSTILPGLLFTLRRSTEYQYYFNTLLRLNEESTGNVTAIDSSKLKHLCLGKQYRKD